MSRHRPPLLVIAIGLSTFAAAPALALVDLVPNSVKTSSSPSHAIVDGFIKKQVAALASDDPTAQKMAREQLVTDAEGHSGGAATPQYQTEYANDLGQALLPLAKSPSLRIRVNAGVVATGVALQVSHTDGSSSSGLAPAVQAMLADKQPAVVLWGVKAAKYVIASDIENGGNPAALAKLVVKAVTDNGDSGPIVEEAYNSLTFKDMDSKKNNPTFIAGTGAVLPDLLDLIAWRGDQYKAGGSTPSPLADRPAMVFIPVTAFSAMKANPAVQNRALKVIGETTCSMLRAIANGNSTPELLDMVREDGTAFDVFGQQIPDPNVQKAGKAIHDVSQNTDSTRMGRLCDDLAAALKGAGVDIAQNGPGAAEPPAPPAVAGK